MQTAPQPLPSAPRWFALLPLLALVAWWPIGAYWASDDFLALHYAQDLGNVAHDFVGPQYGATDVWWFYRPLITASFWLDQTLGGAGSSWSHCSNVIAHACSTLLAALIWRRYTDDRGAFVAGMLWACMPGHVGSIAWAVGRVDSHTTVWCLLTVWLWQRRDERRDRGEHAPAWPVATAFALALMSKELAFTVPPLLTWIAFATSRAAGRARARDALRRTLRPWLVFAVYVPFRFVVLGRFGGYDASTYQPLPMLSGFGQMLLDQTVPLRWIGSPEANGVLSPTLFAVTAALPVAIAVLIALWRRPRTVIAAAVAFAVAAAPMASFFAFTNPHNLRYYYLPSIALCGVLALAGRGVGVAVLLAWLWPLIAVREVQHRADRQDAAMHQALLQEAPTAPPGPLFVAGLPHQNRELTAVQLHFGVDRMLRRPFCDADRTLYAWRPLAEAAGVVRLENPGEPPFALPLGSTWWFADDRSIGRAPAAMPLPDLPITGDVDGVFDLTTPRLDTLIDMVRAGIGPGDESFGLRMPGVRPPALRITIFTANGYLSCLCLDHARDDAKDGWLDALRFLSKVKGDHALAVGNLSTQTEALLGEALVVPTTIDLDPSFPTLIEGGTPDLAKRTFTPTHRARRMILFRFDRDYPRWVHRTQHGD